MASPEAVELSNVLRLIPRCGTQPRSNEKTRQEFLPAAFCILGSSNFETVAVR